MTLEEMALVAKGVPGAEWCVFSAIAKRHVSKDSTAAFVLAFTPERCAALIKFAQDICEVSDSGDLGTVLAENVATLNAALAANS